MIDQLYINRKFLLPKMQNMNSYNDQNSQLIRNLEYGLG